MGANAILKAEADDIPYLHFLYCGFFFPSTNRATFENNVVSYSEDGIHFSDNGLRKLYHTLRGLVIRNAR